MDHGWSWVILIGGAIIQMIVSLLCVVGIFNVIFLEVFQKDRQTTAWLAAVQSSLVCLFGLPAGHIIKKLGPRTTTILGAFLGGLGFFLAYFANGIFSLFLTFGLLVGEYFS
ncbi:hypothetical protein LSH36_616g03011 [Paralvinella palmiformis]|uniref:Major facilitator superfamily (MFS) profile domain-containing protein n=1 Tax=Paralvinella palmiformis TaxID=53620 RepID=A0AAD9MX75_9ANNE|nr:hypothetical protein LSH36_616g03011 [Paralvinella palmiformis]